MQPVHRRLVINGITLSLFEWGPDGDGTIVLAHATGFHARCWDRVVAHLGVRRVIAVDQRGHGRSDKPLPVHWQDFGDDLAGLIRALDLTRVIGVGHSMGGHAMTQAAAAEPRRFERLVLIDPVIVSPEEYAAAGGATLGSAWQHPTAKRRNRWTSPEEMFERFKDRQPFAAWSREVLHDYCTYGLLLDPSGDGFVLACPPEFEAAVYMAARSNAAVYDSVRAIDVPVLLIRVMEPPPDRNWMDFRYSPTWPGLIEHFRAGREIHLPEETHFLPMEKPELVARLILEGA